MDAPEPRCVILTGPTGVGKSALALDVAAQLDGEIISADSRQIYRRLDIGTAKPSPAEQAAVPHHQIDTHEPDEVYSAGEYARDTLPILRDVAARGRLPLITGGSGFYIEALIHPLYAEDEPDRDEKEALRRQYQEWSDEQLQQRLREVDPESAGEIALNDRKKMIRYLEIYEVEGRPPSELFRQSAPTSPLDYQLLVLHDDRERLYERINSRVEQMIADGLVAEVQQLLDGGSKPEDNAMLSVGYREIITHLQGDISLEKAIELIKKNSRNYAKRQLTWSRRWTDAVWVHFDSRHTVIDLIREAGKG